MLLLKPGYQWYGFTTISDLFTTDAFYICKYTEDSLLKTNADDAPDDANVGPVEKSSDPCFCSADERVMLSTASDTATFQTPQYPKNYCSDNNCRWVVTITEGYAIQLEWLVFSTEHQMDFVYVYDGQTDDSPLLAKCSGWMCTSQRSSSNTMQIHFHSDHVTTDLGFKAKVIGIENDLCFCSQSKMVSLVNLHDTVSIVSPKYPLPYCSSHHCGWTITAPEGYGLQLRWNAFDTLPDSHIVYVFDGDVNVGRCSGVTCGDLITSDHRLGVEFITDAMRSGHTGFQATIIVVNNYCERHKELSADEGSISYTAVREVGIPAGANATFTCGVNRKIIDSNDQTSLVFTCQPPKWSRELPTCIPACEIKFRDMIDLHDVHFCTSENGVRMLAAGEVATSERFDLINQQSISVVNIFACSESGWTLEMPIVCDMINNKQDLGDILLIGGHGLSSIESFNPVFGSGDDVIAHIDQVRQRHIAVAYEGKVLIAGGSGSPGPAAYSSASLFDTQNVAFVSLPNMLSARSGAGAAALANSIVLCGGHSEIDVTLNTCEQFIDGQWHWMSAMKKARQGFALVNLDDKLFAIGGWSDDFSTLEESMESWNSTDGWAILDTKIPVKHSFSAVVFHKNIILCGGSSYGITDFGCDRYVSSQVRWHTFPSLQRARKDHAMVAAFGTIYLFGGTDNYNEPLKTIEVFDTRSKQWQQLGGTISDRIQSAVVALGTWTDMEAVEEEFLVRGPAIFHGECSSNLATNTIRCPKGNVTLTYKGKHSLSCLELGNPAEQKHTIYVEDTCLVLHADLTYNQIVANTFCSATYGPYAHLAVVTSDQQMKSIVEQMDLLDGVWTAGKRNELWGQAIDGKHVATNNTPLWAFGFPKDNGSGIMLHADGMINAEISTMHPFICQINYRMQQTGFLKAKKNGRASASMGEPLLDSAESRLTIDECAFECHRNAKCKSFAHSTSTSQCFLYWLPTNQIFLTDNVQFHIFDKTVEKANAALLSFKDACLELNDATKKSTYLDGACLVVNFAELLSQNAARLRCSGLYDNGQLAATFDQNRISDIAAILDLSNSVWTNLLLTAQNKASWYDDVMGKTNTVNDPSWAAQYPHPNKDIGVALRHDGLVTAELESIHPFLCEFFESPVYIEFESVAEGAKPSNAILGESTAFNNVDCRVSCMQEQRCRSYAFSSSQNQCQLFWLFGNSLTLESDPSFQLMTRVPSDQDCIDPSVCLPELPRMLVIGGHLKKSIESYYINDPSKNQVVANLTDTLAGHVAVVMLDGRVMIAGGVVNWDVSMATLGKTVIFDPKSNSFSPSPDMLEPRYSAAGALLSGAVVVCGGHQEFLGRSSSTCEQYMDGHWSSMTPLTYARHDHRLVNVEGHLYALGGYHHQASGGSTVTEVEKFNRVTNKWSTVAPMVSNQQFLFGAAVLHDQIYTCGKFNTICSKYDPIADQWSSITPMSIIRSHNAMVAFYGKLYSFGGDASESSVEVYNPETDHWSMAPSIIEDRQFAAAVVVV